MRKIFNNKLKNIFHFKANKSLTRREKRWGEYFYTRLKTTSPSKESRHLVYKKFPMSPVFKKKLGIYSYYTKGYYKKKISKKYTMLNIGHFLKIKKIPLRYTSLHSIDSTDQRLISMFH